MSRPPEVPDAFPNENEIREVIEHCLNDVPVTTAEMTDVLLFFLNEGEPLFTPQTTYFVLGSYKKYQLRRLRYVENQLNRRLLSYAFLLCDLLDPDELSFEAESEEQGSDNETNTEQETADQTETFPWTHVKFHLLLAYSTYGVLVFEGRHAGPTGELGEIVSHQPSFEKTYVLPRVYDSLSQDDIEANREHIDVESPYSQVQLDKFHLCDRIGQVLNWERKTDLISQVRKIP